MGRVNCDVTYPNWINENVYKMPKFSFISDYDKLCECSGNAGITFFIYSELQYSDENPRRIASNLCELKNLFQTFE